MFNKNLCVIVLQLFIVLISVNGGYALSLGNDNAQTMILSPHINISANNFQDIFIQNNDGITIDNLLNTSVRDIIEQFDNSFLEKILGINPISTLINDKPLTKKKNLSSNFKTKEEVLQTLRNMPLANPKSLLQPEEKLVPTYSLSEIVQALESIRRLIDSNDLRVSELQSIILVNNNDLVSSCNIILELEDLIKKEGLAGIIELSKKADINEIRLYQDLLNEYGTAPFVFLLSGNSSDQDKGITTVFELIEKIRNAQKNIEIEEICAFYLLASKGSSTDAKSLTRPVSQGGDSSLFFAARKFGIEMSSRKNTLSRVEKYFLKERERVIQKKKEQQRSSGRSAYKTEQDVIKTLDQRNINPVEDVQLQRYTALLKKYSIANISILKKNTTFSDLLIFLNGYESIIDKVGIEKVVSFAENNKSMVFNLLASDSYTWEKFLLYVSLIEKKDMQLVSMLMPNIVILKDASENSPQEFLKSLFFLNKDNPGLNIIEEGIIQGSGVNDKNKEYLAELLKNEKLLVRRVFILRGILWSHVYENYDIWNNLVEKEDKKVLPDSLNFAATVFSLMHENYFKGFSFEEAVQTKDFRKYTVSFLVHKIEQIFELEKIAWVSEDFEASFFDTDFLTDLFNFKNSYNKKPFAEKRLKEILKAYLENGNQGVFNYKLSQELSKKQVPEYIAEKMNNLVKAPRVRVAMSEVKEFSIFKKYFSNTLENYDRHVQELSFDIRAIEGVDENAMEEQFRKINNIAKLVNDEQLKKCIMEANLDLLKAFDVKRLNRLNKKLRNRAIGELTKLLVMNQEKSLKQAIDILKKVRGIKNVTGKDQTEIITNIYKENQALIPTLISYLGVLHRQLTDKNKPEAQIVLEVLGIIKNISKAVNDPQKEDIYVDAEISFDFKELLKIGRYGAGGMGNCQSSTAPQHNESLMSFIGDANELTILLRNSTGEIIGFALLHGVFFEKDKFGYILEGVYTNHEELRNLQVEAANRIARYLANYMQVPVFKNSRSGENIELTMPPSVVPRYIDSFGRSVFANAEKKNIPVIVTKPQDINQGFSINSLQWPGNLIDNELAIELSI